MKEPVPFSRTDFIPSHVGDDILPADPLFTRLLTLAHRPHPRPAIRDVNAGIERTAAQLLSDVLKFRRIVRKSLTPRTIDDLHNGREVYISLVAPGGYEFTVGVLAVLALGAAVSPFSSAQPVKEACYYVNKARSVAVLAATPALSLGQALANEIRSTTNSDFTCIPINTIEQADPFPLETIKISSNRFQDPNAPGVVIFTSGTTGPPKGAVLSRAAMINGGMSFAQNVGLQETDVLLHLLPVHHATGIWVSFFPFIQSGACIEFKSGGFDPEWTWNRWRKGGLTHFTGVPTIYMRMMRYYLEHATKLSPAEAESFTAAAAAFKVCICGTSALPKPISDFWTTLMNGRRIVQRYGSTELGVIFNMSVDPTEEIPDGSVGELTYGVDVKLSEGDEGEVLAKSCHMFSKYLHDPEATANAHDADGYFKSGDVARREGKHYFIVGRASVDIIKSGGYKISALDIERELLALPYLGEAMVVGVPDEEFGQRLGAVVSLRTDEVAQQFYNENNRGPDSLKLDDLRADVRSRLAGYKLPTLLRIIEGELPKSGTGKVVKKTLGPLYFPANYGEDREVQVWSSRRPAGSSKL
ncbi:fatty-acyl-CoA synthase [Exophiala viscosa]|uniref:Fatty-acyl-CoA synthase n=1 Tax=Exophiala viscosa TaxID=2486360 RepID=A0AAN6DTY2_9EURO|nr:fatty-acyl-CoA synthase [Exophiala viscosa]